jgi:DNA-binding CsgD family transcriptional regulator
MPNRPRAFNSRPKEFVGAAPACTDGVLPLLIVVNDDLDAVLVSECFDGATNLDELLDLDTRRLRAPVDAIVRDLIASCSDTDRPAKRLALLPQGFRFISATKLHGDGDPLTAVTVESCGDRDHFARAARLYAFSPRETEVLLLVLEGAPAAEIAGALNIAEGTVQGYLKRLLSKTRSRNRTAMVAKVLGWDSLQEASRTSHIA